MSASKSLPARPSLESLRKQAKQLARDVAKGDARAIARTRAQLPNVPVPLTQRNAQLVLAREYGYPGWHGLMAEVGKRLGNGLEWAITQARRAIHDNDVDRLKQLVTEYPALLTWQDADDNDGSVLAMATGAYGDAFDPERERTFTRMACAELLIDAGAVVTPAVVWGLLDSRARGLLQMFQRRGLLPRTLPFLAALGDGDGVRAALAAEPSDAGVVEDAFVLACRYEHREIAAVLLDRCIALDRELGARVDGEVGRAAFIEHFVANGASRDRIKAVWTAFVTERVKRLVVDGDLTSFTNALRRDAWLLGDAWVDVQAGLIATAALNGRAEFITTLLDLDPAILHRQPAPPSQAIEFAIVYAHIELIPLLTRIWPLPNDLPHAAALGDLPRVKAWFDESGALREPHTHYPYNDARARSHLRWDPPSAQQVLDVALAFAVTGHHFDVADFLLQRGADINTNWNSHEPASLLHHLVALGDAHYDALRFVIDRGIDMTIEDYRWNSTARGWALYGMNNPPMAQWLEAAERQREQGA